MQCQVYEIYGNMDEACKKTWPYLAVGCMAFHWNDWHLVSSAHNTDFAGVSSRIFVKHFKWPEKPA